MAANPPLNSVNLGASSIADDIGYVALHDLAKALDGITRDYRVIGGHMVTTLAARWQLGAGLYRETGDVAYHRVAWQGHSDRMHYSEPSGSLAST